MWKLDYAGLWACLDACSESDFIEEIDFLKRMAHDKMDHPVLFCFPNGEDAYVVVRVMLDFFIDYVDVDMVVELSLLRDATVLTTQACYNETSMIQLH